MSTHMLPSVDILFDFTPSDEANERELSAGQDTMNTAQELFNALVTQGHRVTLHPVTEQTYEGVIRNLQGDVVFNQVEEDVLGEKVLLLLESLHHPVTGVDSAGFALSWDKTEIKQLLLSAGVPTPKYFVVEEGEKPINPGMNYPLFVKAADDHGSLSITENSVVHNDQELEKQVIWVHESIEDDALIEEYIDGRELGVTVLGNSNALEILPIKEIVFGKEFDNRPRIVTFEAKWKEKSIDYQGTSVMGCPADLTPVEQKAVETSVRLASQVLGVRDYARFDIRLKDAIAYVIDYNANPGIGPHDASALPAKVYGLSYPEFISRIVMLAYERQYS